MRLGDVCDQGAAVGPRRRCDVTGNLSRSLDVLRGAEVERGSLFVATNSPAMIEKIEAGGQHRLT